MPVSTNSSSASRRFLPKTSKSSAGQKQFNSPSSALSTNRFAGSTPQVTSSTPSARPHHVRNPVDEIETHLEDQSSSSPQLPSRLRFSSSLARARDAIYDDSDDDDDESPAASRVKGVTYADEDDLSDLLYLEKLRHTNVQQSPELERDVNLSGSLTRKRRRTSRTDRVIEDVISISSSPSPSRVHEARISDDDELPSVLRHSHPPTGPAPPVEDTDPHGPSSPLIPAHTIPPTKFRIPTPAVFPPPTPSNTSTRPSFKLPPVQGATAEDPSLGFSSLPSAFSPSRRRGKRDYVPGGAADTVRSWVLALAEREANSATSASARTGTTQAKCERIRAVEVRDDDDGGGSGGRCVLVKDEKGRRWVLINNEAATGRAGGGGYGGGEAAERKGRVKVGSTIEIRSSTIPTLRLGRGQGHRSEGEQAEATGGGSRGRSRGDVAVDPHDSEEEDEWLVGIMWDVPV